MQFATFIFLFLLVSRIPNPASALFCSFLLFSALFCSFLLFSALFCSFLPFTARITNPESRIYPFLHFSAFLCSFLLFPASLSFTARITNPASALFCTSLLFSAFLCIYLHHPPLSVDLCALINGCCHFDPRSMNQNVSVNGLRQIIMTL